MKRSKKTNMYVLIAFLKPPQLHSSPPSIQKTYVVLLLLLLLFRTYSCWLVVDVDIDSVAFCCGRGRSWRRQPHAGQRREVKERESFRPCSIIRAGGCGMLMVCCACWSAVPIALLCLLLCCAYCSFEAGETICLPDAFSWCKIRRMGLRSTFSFGVLTGDMEALFLRRIGCSENPFYNLTLRRCRWLSDVRLLVTETQFLPNRLAPLQQMP